MRDSNQYNIGWVSSSQKGVDINDAHSECVFMKVIIPLAVLAMAGSAFAGDYVESSREIIARMKPQTPDVVAEAKRSMANQAPYVPTPDAPSKPSSTSYTIVALPDGKTATALTFH